MIVVSNTSPLTNLASIGQFDLLQKIYAKISISDGVWQELNAMGTHWPGREEVATAKKWIKRFQVKNTDLVHALRRDIDLGESESIVLALELKADFILMDEKEGEGMNWKEIRQKHPKKFILMGDLREEEIKKNTFRILGGTVLKVSDDPQEIRQAYREYNRQGKDVLYSFPNTPEEFIVEDIPSKGILP